MEIFLKKSINHHWLSSPFKHHNFSKKQLSKTHWECHEFDSELLRIELVSVSMSFCFSRTACIAAFGTRRCDLQSWKVSHSRFSRKPNVKHLDSFRFICICSISYRHLHNVQSYMWTKLNKFNLYQYSIIVICPSGRSLCWCFCWQVCKTKQLLQLNRDWNDVTEGANLPMTHRKKIMEFHLRKVHHWMAAETFDMKIAVNCR